MKKALLILKGAFLLITISIFLINCSSKSNNTDKFLGNWRCNKESGSVWVGDKVEISTAGNNLNVVYWSGGEPFSNSGVLENGKIKVSFPFKGETEITYSEKDGHPHISIFGAEMDKVQ